MDENDDEGPFNTSTIILYTGVGESTNSFEWEDITLREKTINNSRTTVNFSYQNNYWALLALILVLGTAAGNILVCLAIVWERRLQNVTNYFLMSLAMTDLMVAILVMPLGILTLVRGYFPLQSVHCLVWICLDVLFCTASIMHLCTISVDRYLSLRYPMKFGRNKTRRRVTLKIIFVWLLSIAMSLPLSLMYSKDHASVLVNGTCQIPDPVYKLVGSIVCFYIPLCVMLITYCLTVQLLARQRQNLGGAYHQPTGWASGWLGQGSALERRCTWRKLLKTGLPQGQNHAHSATSTETELSTLDTHELWLPDSSIPDPTPSTMTALHQFGAEMLKLSRGLESVSVATTVSSSSHSTMGNNQYSVAQEGEAFQLHTSRDQNLRKRRLNRHSIELDQKLHIEADSPSSEAYSLTSFAKKSWKRRSSAAATPSDKKLEPLIQMRKRFNSLPRNALGPGKNDNDRTSSDSRSDTKCSTSATDDRKSRSDSEASKKDSYLELPPPCTCPYFGDRPLKNSLQPTEVKIISTGLRSPTSLLDPDVITIPTSSMGSLPEDTPTTRSSPQKSPNYLPIALPPVRKLSYSKTTSVVTWDATRNKRRGSSFGGVRTSLLLTPTKIPPPGIPLRRSATLRNHNNIKFTNSDSGSLRTSKIPSSPCLLQRTTTIRSHHSRNSSVISRNSSRHGRIIRLEQKATKVLGVVFFTFVILWAPFFVLNLLPTVCRECEERISHWVFDVVTWLGYASSMVNPIFYTIFNKVFRQAFKNVLMCKYGTNIGWRPNR